MLTLRSACKGFRRFGLYAGAVLGTLLTAGAVPLAAFPVQTAATTTHSPAPSAQPPGVALSPEQLAALLPPSVYFSGQTAPLQLRNAGGIRFSNGSLLWIALVDSSGYSSTVQQRYQFYLVTEGPVRVGDVLLQAGAYGGGFVGDRFVLMDLGDHTVGEGPTQADPQLPRPRPLQFLAARPDAVKLYLGRRWVAVRAEPGRP